MASRHCSMVGIPDLSNESPTKALDNSPPSPNSDSVARAVVRLLPSLMSPAAVETQDSNASVVEPKHVDQHPGTGRADTNGDSASQPPVSPQSVNGSKARRASVAFPEASPAQGRKRTRSQGSPHNQTQEEAIIECPASEVPVRPPAIARRASQKVSRACDFCKQRKARCTGTLPCDKCTKKGLTCRYNSSYSRGRPPTPPPSTSVNGSQDADNGESRKDPAQGHSINLLTREAPNLVRPQTQPYPSHGEYQSAARRPPVSRASPELGMTEIEGQVFDPTSGFTFMHRAWKRLAKRGIQSTSPGSLATHSRIEDQPLMLAGDLPLPTVTDNDVAKLTLPSLREAKALLSLYFETCIVTYRILHPPSVENWLVTAVQTINEGRPVYHQIGRARASILLSVLAIATAHDEKELPTYTQTVDEEISVSRSDYLYCISQKLAGDETGPPLLESAQARVLHTLYLLLSSRMNLAWYTFGNALQIISALGLHRRAPKKSQVSAAAPDYRQAQLRIRTFWTAYILDKYLGVVQGRPRHYHDEDIDQVYPDRVEDDDMGLHGGSGAGGQDCHVDALICHAKIARIVGAISREVYSIQSITEMDRCVAANRLSRQLQEWRANLPPHLGTIRPSMLIRSFRRQSQVLQLAYCHAVMHANRLFLLGNSSPDSQAQAMECVEAAQTVLESVDRMANDGPWIQAFWWTQYVAFHALVITYVWDIQRRRWELGMKEQDKHDDLMALAGRCQTHLAHATARNSPSRRYAVILEEFRSEALGDGTRATTCAQQDNVGPVPNQNYADPAVDGLEAFDAAGLQPFGSLLDGWQPNDWLDLDSSAFGFMDLDPSISYQWEPSLEP
ncbi:fungal specific transcription factor domain-containing protein [Sarocladium implicatum]|nr:fungal specific transcription factor domain-containing protein [Sarocladium implicatum]